MPANTSPIFVLTPRNWFSSTGTSANTALDGTGTVVTIATAGSNGAKVARLRLTHLGTNVATVVRFFVNNGGANTTASNNMLVKEVTMAANTLSQVAASIEVEVDLDLPLAPTYKLNCTIGTAIASGIAVQAEGGDY